MKALLTTVVIALLLAGCSSQAAVTSPRDTARSLPSPRSAGAPARSPDTFDRHRHSLTDPTSTWVIVNKRHPIRPLDYQPRVAIVRGYQVARAAAGPLTRLLGGADRAGVPLKIASAYRSYGYQVGVHDHLVAVDGQQEADAVSARPGYSEHQTGLAVDLEPLGGACALDPCFAHTAASRWLATHAWRYGFIVRYTQANSRVTGYSPEPWHFRYVGRPLARELRRTGAASLEQFFHVRGGDYPPAG